MGIPSVTETPHRAPAMPAPVAAPAPGQAASKRGPAPQPVHVAAAPPPPPPPPPKATDLMVEVGEHKATKTKTYSFVDPDTGAKLVQIPVENVLNLVANILQKMEAEGKR
jgi:hypothetical protein